jgi:cellulose synthase/poly-beta-1,6-N-acetylglucosamine synthase-like glycosyltransferase
LSIQKSILEDDNLSEQKIKENWQSTDIQVSIVCTAYNHELYIRDAIEGFLSQETNFAFEVIIHDDASTDETPKIIMIYHRRFPSIIIPILQKEIKTQKVLEFSLHTSTH